MKSRVPIATLVRHDPSIPATLWLCSSVDEASQATQWPPVNDDDQQSMACFVDVPASLSTADFMVFIDAVRPSARRIRFFRAVAPHAYTVLLRFANKPAMDACCTRYHGRPFHHLSETCQCIPVQTLGESPTVGRHANEVVPEEDQTCPVCLERMDDSVTPLLTILCQHTFHVNCLRKWGDGRCPVCRYSHRPTSPNGSQSRTSRHISPNNNDGESACTTCGSTNDLYVCLICGHLGCGPADTGHAFAHYLDTSHVYALQADTERAWDFSSQGYVHRLIQNAVDGKLVEHVGPSDDASGTTTQANTEKMDALSMEYAYLFTSQLESQQLFYEDRVNELTIRFVDLTRQLEQLTIPDEASRTTRTVAEVEANLAAARKLHQALERQQRTLTEKQTLLKQSIEEERAVSYRLHQNNDALRKDLEDQTALLETLSQEVQHAMETFQ